MGDRGRVVEEQDADHGRAHAFAVGLGAGRLVDDLVRAEDRVAQDDAGPVEAAALVRLAQVFAGHRLAHQVHDGLHGNAARHLARVVSTHAVGKHDEADVAVEGDRVLVVFAHPARIGMADALQLAFQMHPNETGSIRCG